MLIKAASHLRPILRLPFLPSSPAASSPFSLPSSSSGGTSLPPNAFTSNAQLAANQHQQAAYAAAQQAIVQQQVGLQAGAAQSGAGAGTGSGFHAGSSRFSGYTGYGRALIQANASQQTASRKTDEDEEDADLSNPRSRASLLRRARARRPSVAQASAAPTRRGRRFNEAGPNVRFIEVVRDEAAQRRRALGAAEQPGLERLEESAIELEDLEVDVVRPRSRSNSFNGQEQAGTMILRGSVWNVGLRPAASRAQGKDLMRVVRPTGLVRHMSARVVVQVETEVDARPAPALLGASVTRPSSPRPARTLRPRSQSTSALASSSRERTDSVAGMSRNPQPAAESEEAITAELRQKLEGRDRDWRRQLEKAIDLKPSESRTATIRQLVDRFRNPPASEQPRTGRRITTIPPYFTVASYNTVLRALLSIRPQGGPISEVLETYNEMLERDVLPNIRTYDVVMQALLVRHKEIREISSIVDKRVEWYNWMQGFVPYGLLDGKQTAAHATNAKEIAQLQKSIKPLLCETNYESVMRIFNAAAAFNQKSRFDIETYHDLLEAAAKRGDIAFAVKAFTHYEDNTLADSSQRPSVVMYTRLVETYALVNDPKGAAEVLEEFVQNEQGKDLRTPRFMPRIRDMWANLAAAHIGAGNPAAADAIIAQTEAATERGELEAGSAPRLLDNGFDNIVKAELRADPTGQSALTRVLARQSGPAPLRDCQQILQVVDAALLRHDFHTATTALLLALPLQRAGRYNATADESVRRLGHVLRLGLKSLRDSGASKDHLLDSLYEVAQANALLCLRITGERFKFNWNEIGHLVGVLRSAQRDADILSLCGLGGVAVNRLDNQLAQYVSQLIKQDVANQATLKTLIGYTICLGADDTSADSTVAPKAYQKYLEARSTSSAAQLDLTQLQFLAVLHAVARISSAVDSKTHGDLLEGFNTLVYDLAGLGHRYTALELKEFAIALAQRVGPAHAIDMLSPLVLDEEAEVIAAVIKEASEPNSPTATSSETAPSVGTTTLTTPDAGSQLSVSIELSKSIDGARGRSSVPPVEAYQVLKQSLTRDEVPHPQTIGRLIQALSRIGHEDKVRELYALAHRVIADCLSPGHQLDAWLAVEDHMLIALCHLGHLEEAGLHRATILDQGGVPSADAYATMISCAKDTTDDASVARELFAESQSLQVQPHLYLYNTIISKLSKARKAESALELFVKMKAQGLRPSSVTYGAVINACCRVGDSQSATTLFNEMQSMPNFKPRVPPYNTMMQLHLTSEPSRELVLHYYNQMVQRGVPPSAHTYKLLLDAYGTLDPVDLDAMDRIFDNLCADQSLTVGGTHWASLINAYGAVPDRVDRAKQIFDSITTHPCGPANGKIDAVCWEAILSVFASHKMPDQMEEYWHKMQASGVRGTAYTQNMLIKGYGLVGRVEEARKVFEAMSDGVTGVAAPNNHPALLTSSGQIKPTTSAETEAIFREPSTYETMIRAELLAGHRSEAEALCARMEGRQYPIPVTARIRAVLHEPAAEHTQALRQIQRSFNTTGGHTRNDVYPPGQAVAANA